MAEFKYEITERIAVLSQSANGWERQLNMVSWNGREPKYDIRDWAPDGSKMGKGISLTHDELSKMMQIDKSAVTRIITNLENKGYVTRTVSESDRRCKHIYLTPEAWDIRTTSQSVETVFYDWLFEGLDAE